MVNIEKEKTGQIDYQKKRVNSFLHAKKKQISLNDKFISYHIILYYHFMNLL